MRLIKIYSLYLNPVNGVHSFKFYLARQASVFQAKEGPALLKLEYQRMPDLINMIYLV